MTWDFEAKRFVPEPMPAQRSERARRNAIQAAVTWQKTNREKWLAYKREWTRKRRAALKDKEV